MRAVLEWIEALYMSYSQSIRSEDTEIYAINVNITVPWDVTASRSDLRILKF